MSIKLEFSNREIYLMRCYAAHYLNYLASFEAPLFDGEKIEANETIIRFDEILEKMNKERLENAKRTS